MCLPCALPHPGLCFSRGLASAHASNQSESKEAARNCSTPPEVFWCVSLYGVLTNAAQLCNVRQTNTCVFLANNSSPYVLSHVCFSRTFFFYVCLLHQTVPSRICLSKHHPTHLTFQRSLTFPLQWAHMYMHVSTSMFVCRNMSLMWCNVCRGSFIIFCILTFINLWCLLSLIFPFLLLLSARDLPHPLGSPGTGHSTALDESQRLMIPGLRILLFLLL